MLNALSFDVEDWYHSVGSIPPEAWDGYEDRLTINMDNILNVLDKYNIKATFFVLGCIAEKYPEMVKMLHSVGHEIASHGYNHRLLYQLTPDEFREDLRRSIGVIEELIQDRVIGYRAPYWSINKQTYWALSIIQQEGLRYDSSIYPIFYGIPNFPQYPCVINNIVCPHPLIEFPPSTIRICGNNLPVGSGFYFRAFPYRLTKWGLSRINKDGKPALICLHPPEFDPDKPKPKTLTIGEYILHYYNLATTMEKFDHLVQGFRFGTIREVLAGMAGEALC